MSYIVIAEDDETLRMGLTMTLESEGYEVAACQNGAQALAAYTKRRPDLLLLDVMMPIKSGYDVCVEIRRRGDSVPIIFLTAKSTEEDVVLGLGLGADDFIAKPLRIRELLARIAAALRRAEAQGAKAAQGTGAPPPHPQSTIQAAQTFHFGKAVIDARRFTVTAEDGVPQPLTIRELGLLKTFREHPGEVLSRDELLNEVWGMEYFGGTRTLDQHIVQIRRKLGSSGELIETIRGVGYRLVEL